MGIKVVYEDNHVLVVEKPCNVPSQKDSTGDVGMTDMVSEYLRNKYNKKGSVYVGLVHRLDRPVGGVMLFAKTSKAASRLCNAIRQKELGKRYLAVIDGTLENEEGTLVDYLLKDKNRNMVYVVGKDVPGAKEAILKYKVLKKVDKLSLVMVELVTGRSHQIRVQFKNIGASLYGDKRYGSNVLDKRQQIALWSYEISFIHPTRRDIMKFRIAPNGNYMPWKLFDTALKNIKEVN